MIDIHCHILPRVDDGSDSMEMSLAMIADAYDSGVRSMIATPHSCPGLYDNYATEDLQGSWDELYDAVHAAGIPMHLYQGMEIMATDDLPDMLENGEVWTLNGTPYFLVEFMFDEEPAFCRKVLSECIAAGYYPIVAHPARYRFVQMKPSIVFDWYAMGCGIQLNKDSLLKRHGHKAYEIGNSLLRHNLVTCVASDAHSSIVRTTDLDEVRELLINEYDEEYAYMLLEENPSRILRGQKLVGFKPIHY
jgi:protein-tyrosine phosphatase